MITKKNAENAWINACISWWWTCTNRETKDSTYGFTILPFHLGTPPPVRSRFAFLRSHSLARSLAHSLTHSKNYQLKSSPHEEPNVPPWRAAVRHNPPSAGVGAPLLRGQTGWVLRHSQADGRWRAPRFVRASPVAIRRGVTCLTINPRPRRFLQHLTYYFHAPRRAVLRYWLRPRPKFDPIPPPSKFMPLSHNTLRHRVGATELLGIMLRNRCWPTTFHTITSGDVDEWCCYLQYYFHVLRRAGNLTILVATSSEIRSHLHQNACPDHTKVYVRFEPWNCWGLYWEIDVGPPLFTLLHSGMSTNGVAIYNIVSMLPGGRAGGRRCDIGCCDLVRNSCPDQIKLSVPSGSSHQIAWGCVQK